MAGEDGLAQQRPGRAAINTLEDPLAKLGIGEVVLAGAGIDHLAGRVDPECADGERGLGIGQWRPGRSAIRRLPDAATCRPGVDDRRVVRIRDQAGYPATDISIDSPR